MNNGVQQSVKKENQTIFLDPDVVRLDKTPSGEIRLYPDGNSDTIHITIVQASPFSLPNKYICFLDTDKKMRGMIENPQALEPDSRKIIDDALKERYHNTIIEQIYEMDHEGGVYRWSVRTDQGDVDILMNEEPSNLRRLGAHRVLMIDIDGNRFEIPDLEQLDGRSMKELAKVP